MQGIYFFKNSFTGKLRDKQLILKYYALSSFQSRMKMGMQMMMKMMMMERFQNKMQRSGRKNTR